jgi:hypothetical protein
MVEIGSVVVLASVAFAALDYWFFGMFVLFV